VNRGDNPAKANKKGEYSGNAWFGRIDGILGEKKSNVVRVIVHQCLSGHLASKEQILKSLAPHGNGL
jgi:hypothetical protein